MIGMNYQSEQYYTYKDLKSLQDILKIDSIGIVNIYEDEQIIEYQIDRSKCFRLSDLIYMIREKFVRIHLGQLLTLFNDLLRKVILLQSQHKIDHQYLEDNRIWLVFQDPNKCIDILFSKIEYTIAFTGYQCQLYEEGSDVIMSAEQKILKIIKDILNNFKINKIFINDSKKDQIIKCIYDPIIQECDQLNIQNTINLILDILNIFKFNSEKQIIELDQTSIKQRDGVKIIKNKYMVEQYWKDLIKNVKGESSFILENVINFKIKSIQYFLENYFSLPVTQESENQTLNQMKKLYDKYQKKLENKTQSIIQYQFDTILKEQLQNFKFEISEDEKQNLIANILNRILNMKLNKYFQNSPHYYLKTDSNQLLQYQLNQITRLSQFIIKEEVELLMDLKILQLINELI